MSTRTLEQIAEHIDAEVRKFTGHTGALPDFAPLIAEAVADKEREPAEWKAAAEIHQVTINALRAEVARLQDIAVNGAGAACLSELRAEVERLQSQRDACHVQFKRIHETLPARSGGYSGAECIDAYFQLRARVAELQAQASFSEEQRIKLSGKVAELEQSHGQIHLALGGQDPDHTHWPDAIRKLEQDRARLDWLCQCTAGEWDALQNVRLSRPLGFLRAAIDAAQEGTQ